ncbi:UNVERIFIED_CONTAM: hypothetical protein HDU68_012897 [Siphonaria sp. JEL0065]|nr:hypothetical protein HDU68_012897 [Siphonaria sp. JEL0065]
MHSFAVIGGGFSGINAAIQIKKVYPHSKLVLFEQGSQLGGAWYWNQYPGCVCDVPSHLYSLSHELNPDWEDHYPSAKSIQKYLESVAMKHRLYETASEPEDSKLIIEFFDYVISATGPLHVPKIPKWKGMSLFKGEIIHTARWTHGFNPAGKRIAVVGTGASAVQVIPELHKVSKTLTVFQRHASWVDKKKEYKYSAIAKWIFKYIPFAMKLWRLYIYLGQEIGYLAFLTRNPIGRAINYLITKDMTLFLHTNVKDRLKQKLLLPTYPAGARRITPSNHYLKTIASPSTTLISGDPISYLTENSIVTEGGVRISVDAIVLATGFELIDVFTHYKVLGRSTDGIKSPAELSQTLSPCPKAYMGTLVPDFPNFFTLLGPNLGFGHQTVLLPMELQMEYVMKLIQSARRDGRSRIEITRDAVERWNEFLKDGFERTVWKSDQSSYYFNQEGSNFTLWPYSSLYMQWIFGKVPQLSDFIE